MRVEKALQIEQLGNPAERALTSVLYTGCWLNDRVNEYLKPFGISEQQFNVLRILQRKKNHRSNLCDIQQQMMHKTSNATRLVEKLRLKGLVTRKICEDNRRMVDISATEKGLKLLEEISKEMQVYKCEFDSKLTKKEYLQLAELLDKLRD